MSRAACTRAPAPFAATTTRTSTSIRSPETGSKFLPALPRARRLKGGSMRNPFPVLVAASICFAWACGGDDSSAPGVSGSPGVGSGILDGPIGSGGISGIPASGIAGPTEAGLAPGAGGGGAAPSDGGREPQGLDAGDATAQDGASSAKPRVWVSSDLTDPQSSNATDTDDIVTMTAFLLTADKYTIEGVVI